MKPLKIILIWLAVMVALSMFSCTTLKNGYSENFRKTTVQKAVVVTSCKTKKNRVNYEGYTFPSNVPVNWREWNKPYQKKDTVIISNSLFHKLKFEL